MKLKTLSNALLPLVVCNCNKHAIIDSICKNRSGLKNLLTMLLCTMTINIYGQTNILNIGAEGGFSIASLRGNENELIERHKVTRIGYMGGLFVQYNFKKTISLRTGAYYERKGSAYSMRVEDQYGVPVENVPVNVNYDYISVPLLLRATFGKKINWFINAGPYIGFLLKQTVHGDAVQSLPELNSDFTEFSKKTETGMSAGIGISYPVMEKLDLSFEVRDNLGLSNTSAVPVYNDGVIKTNALNFLVGVSYKLKERNADAK